MKPSGLTRFGQPCTLLPICVAMTLRYRRQMRFVPLGDEGLERLATSRVAVVGVGALGSVIAERLVRAGVGYVRLIDRDWVE